MGRAGCRICPARDTPKSPEGGLVLFVRCEEPPSDRVVQAGLNPRRATCVTHLICTYKPNSHDIFFRGSPPSGVPIVIGIGVNLWGVSRIYNFLNNLVNIIYHLIICKPHHF